MRGFISFALAVCAALFLVLAFALPLNLGADTLFGGGGITGAVVNGILYATNATTATSTAAPTNGQVLIGSTAAAPVLGTLTGTASQVIVTNGAGSITLATPQNIHTGASPTFAGLTLSSLTANSFLYSGTGGLLTTTVAPTNGQVLIGSTGAAPVLGTLTGTANVVTATNGPGSITLNLATNPQIPGLVANTMLFAGTAGALTSTVAPTNGQVLIGSTGLAPVLGTLTGTASQVIVTNGAGSITLATPQNIHAGASPTFLGLTLSSLTANSFLYSGAGGLLTTTVAPTNGQVLIGSTAAAPAVAALTAGTNMTVTNGAGSITLAPKMRYLGTSDFTATACATAPCFFPVSGVNGDPTEAQVRVVTGQAGTFNTLYCLNNEGAGSETITFRKNAVATALACTATTGNTCTDTVDSVSVIASDSVTLGSSNANPKLSCAVTFVAN